MTTWRGGGRSVRVVGDAEEALTRAAEPEVLLPLEQPRRQLRRHPLLHPELRRCQQRRGEWGRTGEPGADQPRRHGRSSARVTEV